MTQIIPPNISLEIDGEIFYLNPSSAEAKALQRLENLEYDDPSQFITLVEEGEEINVQAGWERLKNVGIKSKYQLQIHQLVRTEDLPNLPESLQEDFQDICQTVLTQDPYSCLGFPNHSLKGRLKDYRALEIDFEGTAYRLVYRIYEKPAPKRILVISFAQHDPAYDQAKERTGR